MIFKYTNLKKHPPVFRAATGLSRAEFDDYTTLLTIKLAEQGRKTLERSDRQRAIGGGRNQDLDKRDQLLLTIVWLRLYPTCEVLGYLFGISDSSAYRVVKRCLPILEEAGREEIERSQAHAARKRGYNLAGIFEQIPGLAVIVDTFEQEIERPSNRQEADRYYSGKKKRHTLKSQVTVDAYTGEILDVAPSESGRGQDKGYFNRSGTVERLPEDTAYMADLGYPGLEKDLPHAAIPRKKPREKPRPQEDKEHNTKFASKRVVVEHSIGQIRNHQALTNRDRHHRRHHTDRVVAVSGIVNFTKRSRYVF
jgi:hypothetical protein